MRPHTRPTGYRIPICQIGGMITYREVDLRADGNDPLMQWIQAAADWEITELRWDEKMDQPGDVTWRGGSLWDATTDGEVQLQCLAVQDGIRVHVKAPFRPKFTGVVTLGGIEWKAYPIRHAAPLPPTHGQSATTPTHVPTGLLITDEGGPYRAATVPMPVLAQTMLAANCTGVVEQAFKDSIERAIRRVYGLLIKLNQNRNA
jgi:alkylation response protein AidB-like acyl-CoA dehydrogenase